MPVTVEIGPTDRHPRPVVFHAHFARHVDEPLSFFVAIQRFGPEVVRDAKVLPTVAIKIDRGHAQGGARSALASRATSSSPGFKIN